MTTDEVRAGLRAAIRLQNEQPSLAHAQAIDIRRGAVDECNCRDQARVRLERLAARSRAEVRRLAR